MINYFNLITLFYLFIFFATINFLKICVESGVGIGVVYISLFASSVGGGLSGGGGVKTLWNK